MAAKNRKKTTAATPGTYVLSRTGVMGWALLFCLAAVLIFVLGILVGRGQLTYPFAADDVQQDLSRKKKSADEADRQQVYRLLKEGDQQQPLEFHEGVKDSQNTVPALKGKPSNASTPKQTPAADTPKPPPAAKAGGYTIQVASVRDVQSAEELVQTLRGMGFADAYHVTGNIAGKGVWHRVRVGHFETKSKAQGTIQRLKSYKLNGFIVKK